MMRGVFLVLGVLFFLGCVAVESTSSTPRVCFGEKCVLVEIADTPEERARGLMYRDALQGNYGMLFVFETEAMHGFWMKNTRIPLDGIWMDAQGKVVDVIRMLPCESDPCQVYTPRENALYVLEVDAGVAENWLVERGTIASISGV